MARKGTVYVSFDIETGGEYCGILLMLWHHRALDKPSVAPAAFNINHHSTCFTDTFRCIRVGQSGYHLSIGVDAYAIRALPILRT